MYSICDIKMYAVYFSILHLCVFIVVLQFFLICIVQLSGLFSFFFGISALINLLVSVNFMALSCFCFSNISCLSVFVKGFHSFKTLYILQFVSSLSLGFVTISCCLNLCVSRRYPLILFTFLCFFFSFFLHAYSNTVFLN